MKKLGRYLILEGILSVGLAYLMYYVATLSSSMELLYKPFEWIGMGLRWLSLSSLIGNWIALFCYGILSLLPMLYLIIRRSKSGGSKVDLLLPVISVFTFYTLYHFINPGLMLNWAPQTIADKSIIGLIKLAFVIIYYSLCLSYFIFRMLGALADGDPENRLHYLGKRLQVILVSLAALYTFLIGYFSTFELFASLNKYSAQANTDPLFTGLLPSQGSSSLNQFITILTYLLQCLPVIFAIVILTGGVNLLKEMASHHLEEEEFTAASQLSSAGKKAVYVTVFSNLALNILQFFLSSRLHDTNFNLNITLFPLIIAFGAMILAGYFKETRELHEDNEMII